MFDIDGTLTNSQPAYARVMRTVLQEYGKPFSAADAQATFPMAAEQAMAHLGISADQFDHFQARYEAVMAAHFTDITLYDGMASVFQQLPASLKVGIVTSQRRNEIEAGMQAYPLMDRMDVVIGADDTPKIKPDPLPLLTALSKVKVAPSDALFIGDSLSDEQTAAAANVDFGLAMWGMDPNANHQRTTYRLQQPLDILTVL